MKKYKYPVKSIVWHDAQGDGGWTYLDDLPEPTLVSSIGYVLRETEDYTTITASITEARDKRLIADNPISIPRKCIVSISDIVLDEDGEE